MSDEEHATFAMATMVPNVVDLREQFPLTRERAPFELGSYLARYCHPDLPGTIEIAADLGIRHPMVREGSDVEPWVMSTDLLLTLEPSDGELGLLAISVKDNEACTQGRAGELLSLEREYWHRRGVPWLLLTPRVQEVAVSKIVVEALPWALTEASLTDGVLQACRDVTSTIVGLTLARACSAIADVLDVEQSSAQQIFWAAVWLGVIPLDFNRRCLSLDPIRLLEPDAFWAQNPIVARRSSWQC